MAEKPEGRMKWLSNSGLQYSLSRNRAWIEVVNF